MCVPTLSMDILRPKMQLSLRGFKSEIWSCSWPNFDWSRHFIQKNCWDIKDITVMSWVYNLWAVGYAKVSVKWVCKCLNTDQKWYWATVPSWFSNIFSDIVKFILTCHCWWNLVILLWSGDQTAVHAAATLILMTIFRRGKKLIENF